MTPIRLDGKKRALATGVALASTGLTSCNNNGAVDPPPPPLECSTLADGAFLAPSAVQSPGQVFVVLSYTLFQDGRWEDLTATELENVALADIQVESDRSVQLLFDLTPDTATSGAFTFSGVLVGLGGERCSVSRRFVFSISSQGVTIGELQAARLPLEARQQATIALAGTGQGYVDLVAHTPFPGVAGVHWAASEGTIRSQGGGRARWDLPRARGVYQAEVLVDYGDHGFSLDTIELEVT